MNNKKIVTLEQARKRDEKWGNSMDGVLDNMKVLGAEVTIEELRGVVAKTLLKLPKKIREKVLDEVVFILMGSGCAGTIDQLCFTKFTKDAQDKKEWGDGFSLSFTQPLILLNFSEMKKGKEMDLIAHEIAHFILGHIPNPLKNFPVEREADDLTEKWGFERNYKEKDYKKFEKTK
ncbi:MAG: hypothetical protein KJ566_03340 [Nanoarchaeota archaeon]|nr:hypothetical protein [Nanoarchaeota archaeon]